MLHSWREGYELRIGRERARVPKIVLATGIRDVEPEGVENSDLLKPTGLLRYCPVCDAYEHRRKGLAVLE